MPNRPGAKGGREVSYIVRVYRRESGDIAGVVEMPVEASREPFRNFAELRAILAAPPAIQGRRGTRQ